MNRLITATLCSLSMAFITGCGSDTKPISAPPVQSKSAAAPEAPPPAPAAVVTPQPQGIPQYRSSLVLSQQQIDSTLAALKDLVDPNQQDLRGAYDKYCDQLARMNQHAQDMQSQADAMRASRDVYFNQWEEKVSDIDNPTIRASAEARRQRLRNAHDQIITASGDAKDAYVPFMKDLQDIKKYLSVDLTKSSVADLSDAAKKVQVDGGNVKDKIGVIITTLDAVQGS